MVLIFLEKIVSKMNKNCNLFPNKKRFSTKKNAETASLLLDIKIKIYYCDGCDGWHFSKIKNVPSA